MSGSRSPARKVPKFSVFNCVSDLDGMAANFAVLNVRLRAVLRKIDNHRYSLEAIRAFQFLFDLFHR
jgi:hypothetical protein